MDLSPVGIIAVEFVEGASLITFGSNGGEWRSIEVCLSSLNYGTSFDLFLAAHKNHFDITVMEKIDSIHSLLTGKKQMRM